MCDFLNSGGYDKQLRRLRKVYKERRDTLVQSLQQHFGPCDLLGTSSGTHLAWKLPEHRPNAATCQDLARAVGVTVNSMKLETVTGPEFLPDWERYLLLGYADLQPEIITEAIERIASVLLENRVNNSPTPMA